MRHAMLRRGYAARAERSARALGIALALLATTAQLGRAAAAPPAIAEQVLEGRVVAFELGELVVDIAADRGAQRGTVLELWHPLSIKHPVTGQVVSDRFLIGRLRLTQVRGALSLAHVEGKPLQPAQPGDIVVLRRVAAPLSLPEKPRPQNPALPPVVSPGATREGEAPEPVANTVSNEPASDDALAVSRLFEALRGATLVDRVRSYEAYVAERPQSKYAATLNEEASQLRRLIALEKGAASRPESALRNFAPPSEARAHAPLSLALELGSSPVGAVIHTRNAGEVAYHTAPMTRVGRAYFSATVEPSRMRAPRLEYFVEAVNAAGQSEFVLGSAEEPQSIEVAEVPTPREPARRPATVSLSSDYADWNNLKGNDVVWQTEGSFGMRFADIGLRAARSGFGVYRGKGGSLEELDQRKLSGRSVGLTYGYLEGEWGLSHFTSLIGRMVIGLEDDGVNGGAQALVRLGNDRETNLTIGAEVLGGIGVRGITELQLGSFPRVPILFRTEVTNQPAGASQSSTATPTGTSQRAGEVGARAIAQVGYRVLPTLVLALRGSYQGRTINHAGPGFGGAVSYQW